jgi:PHD/YefM family antitoxin component YafN of YafNO toxin-antitoxin module
MSCVQYTLSYVRVGGTVTAGGDGMADPTRLTASSLRANIYRVLDQVLETGVPVDIERHGRRLRIVQASLKRAAAPGKLMRLKARRYLRASPEALVHIDWCRGWRP